VLDEGRGDQAAVMAKTAKLRQQRLAKEAAEREAAAKVEHTTLDQTPRVPYSSRMLINT
jgi:hypothetical protein